METHYADKGYRKRALWLLAGIVLMCGVLLWQLQLWLAHVTVELGNSSPETVRAWLRWLLSSLGMALAIPAFALGLTLRRMAFASRIEGRFPPAQWKTMRDVRILRDATGLKWARRVEAAGTTALLLGGSLVGWSLWAWWRFGG